MAALLELSRVRSPFPVGQNACRCSAKVWVGHGNISNQSARQGPIKLQQSQVMRKVLEVAFQVSPVFWVNKRRPDTTRGLAFALSHTWLERQFLQREARTIAFVKKTVSRSQNNVRGNQRSRTEPGFPHIQTPDRIPQPLKGGSILCHTSGGHQAKYNNQSAQHGISEILEKTLQALEGNSATGLRRFPVLAPDDALFLPN